MNPATNPYAPGAGTPPPELAGRDAIIADAKLAIVGQIGDINQNNNATRAFDFAVSVVPVADKGRQTSREPDEGRSRWIAAKLLCKI